MGDILAALGFEGKQHCNPVEFEVNIGFVCVLIYTVISVVSKLFGLILLRIFWISVFRGFPGCPFL